MTLQVNQIEDRLKKDFVPYIDTSDINQHAGTNLERQKLTRALAAMCIAVHAHIPAQEAAACVTDGANDDGIDAICYSSITKTVYIVQSKYKEHPPSPTDVEKFTRGIMHLLDGNYDFMNRRLQSRREEIDENLNDCDHIVAVFCYLSADAPAEETLDISTKFTDNINASGEILKFQYMKLSDIHAERRIAQTMESAEVDLQVEKWLTPGDYKKEIMGIVTGNQIAELYTRFGDALFDNNIRKVIQNSETNNLILDTIRNTPSSFWAYNNGITILTNTINCIGKPRPSISGSERFKLSSVSIVNGAQTSGALGRALDEGIPLDDIYVTVRIISTEGQEETFGQNVTRFTNTQNTIGVREFVALDPNQEYWHQTLRDEGYLYTYKTGGQSDNEDFKLSFGLEEATRALACLSGIEDATRTKSKISQMWSNIEGERYKRLFPEELNVMTMVNAVIFWRSFNDLYSQFISSSEGKRKKVLQEGTYACCTLAMEKFGYDHVLADVKRQDIDGWLQSNARLIEQLANTCFDQHEAVNGSGYAGSFFKNSDKVSSLADTLRQKVLHQS